jgi:Asp-tRNA(Asn)/Glu-tRNA(Gln) amidotransferase A subunit family amidase
VDELCDRSAVELRRLIEAKEISPVELLDSCLARIERVNPALNAVVALDEARARAAAREAEAAALRGDDLGLLHGLPVGIKDLNPTAGLRTTFGSPLFAQHVPEADDSVVAAIRAAGGIVLGKTNTPEFGAGANTFNQVYGFTGNPFDPERSCAGSSGGSAVALATSMVPLANGSDLGGSLRTPAAFCGVAGLRPTPGTVPKTASVIAYWPLSVEGPMARSVADLRLMLSAMVGADPRDPLSGPEGDRGLAAPESVDLSAITALVSEDLGFAPMDDRMRRLFRERLDRFAGGFGRCERRDPPMHDADRVFEVLRSVGFLAAHEDKYQNNRDQVGPNVAANVALGLTYSAADVAWAAARHTEIYRGFLDFMADCDVLITPAAAAPPFGKDQLYPAEINGRPLETYIRWIAITYGITLTGHPAVVLPCGLDWTGAPFGLQLVGRRGREGELLAVAEALETELERIPECCRPVPDLEALTKRTA